MRVHASISMQKPDPACGGPAERTQIDLRTASPAVLARRDIGLNVRELLPPLPQGQVEAHLSARLFLAWGIGHLDVELMRVNMGRGTAHPLQKALQVEEKPWVTDENVQAAGDAPEWPQRGIAHEVSP
jgi:hypothetical protein